MTMDKWIELVKEERQHQDRKWGASKKLHNDTFLRSLREELGEVSAELETDGDGVNIIASALIDELIQCVAVCANWMEQSGLSQELALSVIAASGEHERLKWQEKPLIDSVDKELSRKFGEVARETEPIEELQQSSVGVASLNAALASLAGYALAWADEVASNPDYKED